MERARARSQACTAARTGDWWSVSRTPSVICWSLSKRTYSTRHTPSLAFRVTNRQAVDLLRQIAPYLRSYKAARAALALKHYIALTPRNGKYREEVRVAREQFQASFFGLGPTSRDPARLRRRPTQ